MTEQDVFGFTALVKRLAAVFRVRTDTEDFKLLTSSYYRALSRQHLADLERGADAWIAGQQKFPKPLEWVQAIPRLRAPMPEMTHAQAIEYHEAERLFFEREPCHCDECVTYGCDWKPQRFVPEFTVDGRDRQILDPLRGKTVTAGHWAHGAELAGYYRAKGEFYAKCLELGLVAVAKELTTTPSTTRGYRRQFTKAGS